MVIRDFKYTAEDVDCQYCLHYHYGRCCSKKCVCFRERIDAGVVSYSEAIKETFDKDSPLRPRIEIVINFYNKLFWKDEAHFKRFQLMDAILGYYKRRNTSEYYASLFLLTSDEELVTRTLDCFGKRKINFANANLPFTAKASFIPSYLQTSLIQQRIILFVESVRNLKMRSYLSSRQTLKDSLMILCKREKMHPASGRVHSTKLLFLFFQI